MTPARVPAAYPPSPLVTSHSQDRRESSSRFPSKHFEYRMQESFIQLSPEAVRPEHYLRRSLSFHRWDGRPRRNGGPYSVGSTRGREPSGKVWSIKASSASVNRRSPASAFSAACSEL